MAESELVKELAKVAIVEDEKPPKTKGGKGRFNWGPPAEPGEGKEDQGGSLPEDEDQDDRDFDEAAFGSRCQADQGGSRLVTLSADPDAALPGTTLKPYKVYTVKSGNDQILFGKPEAVAAELEKIEKLQREKDPFIGQRGGREFPDIKELEEQFRSRPQPVPANPLTTVRWIEPDYVTTASEFTLIPVIANEEFQFAIFTNDKQLIVTQCLQPEHSMFRRDEFSVYIKKGAEIGFAVSQRNRAQIVTALGFDSQAKTYNFLENSAAGPLVSQSGQSIRKTPFPGPAPEHCIASNQQKSIAEATVAIYVQPSRLPCPAYFFDPSIPDLPVPEPSSQGRSTPKWTLEPHSLGHVFKQWIVQFRFYPRV